MKVFEDLFPCHVEQGPDDLVPDRRDAGEAGNPGTPEEPLMMSVSAWSPAVWPVAMRCAPIVAATLARNS